ncbi:unnamed protein product [Medioppia subpectinata]|uniref:Breast cancer metastasis-suppressor 1-like protein n=1 Tax=Medioppia subpectinata TaxID=1979941 RepID=A0A7R9KX82_9ACAR|nr:unnamed protein product [Medioppia subpectinata]CAG2110413.1 unnamed protein product [Medioppia subpectinata]
MMSNKLIANQINSELKQLNAKRNLMIGGNELSDTHMSSIDTDHLKDHMDDQIDSDKDDTNDDSETDSQSGSDGEESSDIDEEECDRRKDEYMVEITDLEKQFLALKDQLYVERLSQVEHKLEEVRAGRAAEYLQPLEELQENMRVRTEVAGIVSQLKLTNIKCQFEAEKLANQQNFESEKQLLKDSIRQDVEEKLRRLEEDRNSIDSDIWSESAFSKKKKRYGSSGAGYGYDMTIRDSISFQDRRRKPVTVSGPYIVYMLKDSDIMEDWNVIRRALKSVSSSYL